MTLLFFRSGFPALGWRAKTPPRTSGPSRRPHGNSRDPRRPHINQKLNRSHALSSHPLPLRSVPVISLRLASAAAAAASSVAIVFPDANVHRNARPDTIVHDTTLALIPIDANSKIYGHGDSSTYYWPNGTARDNDLVKARNKNREVVLSFGLDVRMQLGLFPHERLEAVLTTLHPL